MSDIVSNHETGVAWLLHVSSKQNKIATTLFLYGQILLVFHSSIHFEHDNHS